MRVVIVQAEDDNEVVGVFESWERSDDFLDNEHNAWTEENTKRNSRMVRD